MTKTISFAKVEGHAGHAPVEPIKPSEPVPNGVDTTAVVPADQPAPTQNALGIYTGSDEDAAADPRDVRFPRLNLVQGLTESEIKNVVTAYAAGHPELKLPGGDPVGHFVLKRAVYIPKPFTAVVVGWRKKCWVETVKFGGEARVAYSFEQVHALGGTDSWRESKENDASGSTRPWYKPTITGLFLIEKPADADDSNFPYVTQDGAAYAAALMTFKSTSFDFYIRVNSERTGLFRGDFSSRSIVVDSAKLPKAPSYFPTVKIGAPTSDALRSMVKHKILGQ
jgi:hypothetical protein